MKIHRKLAAIALIVSLTGAMSLTAAAQQKGCGGNAGAGTQQCQKVRGCAIQDLTQEQQDKIEKSRLAFAKEALKIKNQIGEKNAHLKTLSMADQADMEAINKTIDELYALKASLAKKNETHIQDIRKMLNDEQRLEFDLKHAKKEKCHNGPACGEGKGACCDKASCCPQSGQQCGKGAGGCGQHGQGYQGKAGGCQHQGKGCQGGKAAQPEDEKK